MLTLNEEAGGKILLVKISGKLSKEDYQRFVPDVERLIKDHGKIRILVQMHDFHGWELGALWEDIKFDMKHFGDIERLALVGESKWEAGMAAFCKPLRCSIGAFLPPRGAPSDAGLIWASGIVAPHFAVISQRFTRPAAILGSLRTCSRILVSISE